MRISLNYAQIQQKRVSVKTNSKNRTQTVNSNNTNNIKTNFLYQTTPNLLHFMGYKVHIADGGAHAENMKHFAQAISDDMDIEMHEVEINEKYPNTKQLKSLEEELIKLNEENSSFEDEYIAITALASVGLLNIQEQFTKVMGRSITLTPENIKSNKKVLLEFLRKIYTNREKYEEYIGYMGSQQQGIEYSWGVIQEINKLIKKGAKVYIPTGHPQDETLKWAAGEEGLKPELYHYIATGEDINGSIKKIHDDIKSRNWYDFNLLALSDANVVGVKGAKGAQDYMFAAYDSCTTDGARGVYNFTPIRRHDDIIGYSYTNTETNEYPFSEFPANEEIEDISKFVGKYYKDVLATKQEIEELKYAIKKGKPTEDCADKLYPIDEVFTEEEIEERKLNLEGKYTDKTLELFFDVNKQNDIIFPRCDCEGSGKPSVMSMWGSCFSTINAIARDIDLEERSYIEPDDETHLKNLKILMQKGLKSTSRSAEDYFNNAIENDKAYKLKKPGYYLDPRPYYYLGNYHYQKHNYEHALNCYNNSLDIASYQIVNKFNKSLYDIKKENDLYESSVRMKKTYDDLVNSYNNSPFLLRILLTKPDKPDNYDDYKKYEQSHKLYGFTKTMAEIYDKISTICEKKGEKYASKICKAASNDIKNCTKKGDEIIKRRADGVKYIGDFYNEIKPD